MTKTAGEIPLRIVVRQPPAGVTFAVQRGKSDLTPPAAATAQSIVFDLTVRIGARQANEPPNLLGPYAQGKPGARFVYVNSGTYAGQADSCWSRRAKVSLQGITWTEIDRVRASSASVLECTIGGIGRDGGPVCASVPVPAGDWKITPR
jgi:hypothetical protein